MKNVKVQYYQTTSNYKAAYVESFNGIIQLLIAKHQEANRGSIPPGRWVDSLDPALHKYNYNREHGFLKMTPFEAEQPENSAKVALRFQLKHSKVKPVKPKFEVNQTVRIWLNKGRFSRRYHADYSREPFIIYKVLTNLPLPRYQLIESQEEHENPEVLKGTFSEDELVLFTPNEINE